MRDRHRPALRDLLRKIGITLPDEPSTLPKRTATNRVDVAAMSERLDDPLAQRLRLTHHRLRVDGLVGGDQDEALDAELRGELGDDLRRDDVVAHGLERMRSIIGTCLYAAAWNTTVGRYFSKTSRSERAAVADVEQLRHGRREVALADELALDLEQRSLGVVDEDEARRADTRAIWRHSSAPIEPPAPVTSTVCSLR